MLHSNAQMKSGPQELYWSKVLASMHNYPRHPARPLVSVVAVKGFGGRKTFLRAAAVLIHLLSENVSLLKTFQNGDLFLLQPRHQRPLYC